MDCQRARAAGAVAGAVAGWEVGVRSGWALESEAARGLAPEAV